MPNDDIFTSVSQLMEHILGKLSQSPDEEKPEPIMEQIFDDPIDKRKRCVICGNIDTFLIRDNRGRIVRKQFIYKDKKTKEHLCKNHAKNNELLIYDKTHERRFY